MGDPMNFETF
jgi:hypothetical protein